MRAAAGDARQTVGAVLTQEEVNAQGMANQMRIDVALNTVRQQLQQLAPPVAALSHPDVGAIDLVWGVEGTNKGDGYGLAKLVRCIQK